MASGFAGKSLLVTVLAFLLLVVLYVVDDSRRWLNTIDLLATQIKFAVRGQQTPGEELRVVGITENAIAHLASLGVYYPFPRDWHATALRRLADAGARVVVVDILFSEADSWNSAEDAALRDGIIYCRERGCDVVLAAVMERQDYAEGVHSETLITPAPLIMEAKPALALSNTWEKLSYKLNELVGLRLPLGPDGEPVEYHTQAVQALVLFCEQEGRDWQETLDEAAVTVIDRRTAETRRVFRINYCAKPERFAGHVYSFERLFPDVWLGPEAEAETAGAVRRELTAAEQAALADIFAGSVVFVGSRARADNDYFNTPFGQMFGVDTNAQAFDTLARHRLIRAVPPLGTLLIAALLALLAWRISLFRPLWRCSLVGTAVLIVAILANAGLFALARVELSLSVTLLGLLLPGLSSTVYQGVLEEMERRRIRLIFGRYVSDAIVAQLIADPSLAGLGGVERTVAVLFNDIRNYSTITERLNPQQIVEFLNAYLGEVTEIIQEGGGFVDKYLGDGLMAFFGAPVPTPDPAGDSIRAALAMIHALYEKVHPRLDELGLPRFKVGVGIHMGPAVMGNIGSERRHDYTLIGDAVNVASRVESQTKEYGWAVLVTREVMEAASGDFDFELVGARPVKGREQPVEMYRVIDPLEPDRYRLDSVPARRASSTAEGSAASRQPQ